MIGQGSVSVHLFYQTYQWLIAGYSEMYQQFWSEFLNDIVTIESPFLEVPFSPLWIDFKMPLTYYSLPGANDDTITITSLGSGNLTNLPGISGETHPNIGYSYFWPNSTGWHNAEKDGLNSWFYVYDIDRGWKFNNLHQRYTQSKNQILTINSNIHQETITDIKKIPDWIWICTFLFLQMILWAERKWR